MSSEGSAASVLADIAMSTLIKVRHNKGSQVAF